MRMKNAMQLKAHVNNMAKKASIPTQALMQSYLLERLLERLSRSTWRDNIVIKGGVLISSLVGVSSRTTMDLDTTVRGFALTHDSVEKVFRDITAVQVDDDWKFEFDRIEDIRETDDYPGIRVHLKGSYAPMLAPLTIDVTTGDRITPDAVEYSYPLLFGEERSALWHTQSRQYLRKNLRLWYLAELPIPVTEISMTFMFCWVLKEMTSIWKH